MGKFRFKKINSKVNKVARDINKGIEEDNLWLGRFYIRQVQKHHYFYEDRSGVSIGYLYEVADKKTKITKRKWFDNYDFGVASDGSKFTNGWRVWCFVNDFIINDIDVWRKENPRDPEFAVDYTATPYLNEKEKIYIGWY